MADPHEPAGKNVQRKAADELHRFQMSFTFRLTSSPMRSPHPYIRAIMSRCLSKVHTLSIAFTSCCESTTGNLWSAEIEGSSMFTWSSPSILKRQRSPNTVNLK